MTRRLGMRSAAVLVVANMVGAGVFTTSGFALAEHTRGVVLLAWVVGGVLATCGALCYGALGRHFPHSGGEYELLRRTVHPIAGSLAGWVSLLAGFSAPIAYAAAALQRYVGWPTSDGAPWLGTLAIVAAGLLHAVHLRVGVGVQNAIVALKLALIVGLIVVGAVVIGGRGAPALTAEPPSFAVGEFAVTCVWVSFAYSGWNAASYVAGEIVDAERALPRALLLGTLATAALYLGLNAVFVFAAPVADLAGRAEVGLVAAAALGGPALGHVVTVVVALALVTSITAMTMAGPRVYARMADDGALPRVFAAGVEHRAATLLQTGLALVMLWTSSFDGLMTFIGWTLSVSSALTVVGLIRLRVRDGAAAVPVVGWPFVPFGFVVATLAIAGFSFAQRPGAAGGGLAVLVVGVVLAIAFDRRRLRRDGGAP